jgi:hypothetical protein
MLESLRHARQGQSDIDTTRMADLLSALAPLEKRLAEHPVYDRMRTLEDVQVFMSHQIFAVWDFMTLLKSLQGRLTSTTLPWRPVGDATTRRLINELVLSEESDEFGTGQYASHYEIYLQAMSQAGASHASIQSLVESGETSSSAADVVAAAALPEAVRSFVSHTWRVAVSLEDHSVAAAFALGRETLLSTLFERLVASLPTTAASNLTGLQGYLNRHIELDGEVHNTLSLRMLSLLCGDDDQKWKDALVVAQTSLEVRIALWDGVVTELDRKLN